MQTSDTHHNIALIGVGNCGSSLVQAITAGETPPGKLSSPFDDNVRRVDPTIFKFAAAFDVDQRKVGLDLSDAIFADPNCTTRYRDVDKQGIKVSCGPAADGVASQNHTRVMIDERAHSVGFAQVADELIRTKTRTVINFIPVGSQAASEGYARSALEANCNFINCTPAFIARNKELQREFSKKGLVLLGDDLKSHLGASVIHGAIAKLLSERGLEIDEMYQLNFGGNGDFLNMLEPERVTAKRETKNATIRRNLKNDVPMTIGPSGFIPHLKDNKICYVNISGKGYMGMPFDLDLKFRVEDSPNAAAVAVDMLRLVHVASTDGSILNHAVLDGYFKDPYTSYRSVN